jgi:hypothetical protein
MPKNEPVEPEPGIEFLVESEENRGKQLSMIFFYSPKLI